MKISNDIKYIGVNDRNIDLFEGQYIVPNGIAYNSYVILDEKIAVMDTVDANFSDQWLSNLEKSLDGKAPDYLIVQHMEPDHSANIKRFSEKYPHATIVATQKAFVMMNQFFSTDFADKRLVVGEGDTLNLGSHTLSFVTAPMVHWPEVMLTYDSKDKVLFSADAFGKFGALNTDEDWACEARRYYFGIVGKYGPQVQALLKKLNGVEVDTICPLHGPVLSENLDYYINLYDIWSSYRVETQGIFIAYASIYGNTKKAALLLKERLEAMGAERVVICDLAREDLAEAVEDAFRHSTLVVASSTYNGDIFPFMKHFIEHLTERNFQNRRVAFMENGTWAPMAAKVMKGMFEKSKNLTIIEPTVTIKSALSDESKAQIEELAKELIK